MHTSTTSTVSDKRNIDVGFLFFLSWMLYANLQPGYATTYMRPQPDPWYVISVQFDPSSLPPGVSVVGETVKLPNYQGMATYRYLHNTSTTPLYLVKTLSHPIDWLAEVPPNEIPVKKLMNGKLFELELENDVWQEKNGRGVALTELLLDDFHHVVGKTGPGRPAVPVVPTTRRIHFRAIYGGKVLTFQATLDYEVNRQYDPGMNNDLYYTNWFQIRSVHLDPKALPPGLKIVAGKRFPHPLLKLTLVNEGRTPLYVTARAQAPVAWVRQFPAGKIPYRKLADGKAWWFSQPRGPHFGNPGHPGWVGGFVPYPVGQEAISASYIFKASGLQSQQIRADDRPQKVDVPPAQNFTLEAFYGTSPITLRGTITYTLNAAYRPDAGSGPSALVSCVGPMCPGANKRTHFFLLTVLSAGFLNTLFFHIYRRQYEHRLSITRCVVFGLIESFVIHVGFLNISYRVFLNSVQWLGLQGFNLVALLLTGLYVGLSLPLLRRYQFSMQSSSVFLASSFLLLRINLWIAGYN